jgi:sortase A
VVTYVVDRVRRPGDPLPPALEPGKGRLVLGSAEGSGWRGGFAPSAVVYVDASLQGAAQPSPGGRPSGVPPAEAPMGMSTQPLLPLVFWLQGLLLAIVATIWLRSRWGRWQTWAVAFPVLLALGIAASAPAAQLLPNLL